jgi:hypothetical protein
MPEARLAPIARRQHGLVTRAQALSVLSPSTLDRRIRARALEPVRRGVYRIAGVPDSWELQLLAACLTVGDDARVSFRAAAALHSFEGFARDRIEIARFGSRAVVIDGVVVHESHVFDESHLTRISGIPTTSVARTLCDLTAVARPWMVERAVDDALRRKLVRLAEIANVAELLEGRGRHRCTAMRDILERRLPGYQPGDSAPERRIAELLVRAGLPPPTQQHPVRVGRSQRRVDLCYPEHRIAIEYDGWEWHSGRRAFDEDRARANELVVLGFSVLRFTSRSSDQAIVDTVRAAIHRTARR